MSKTPSTTSPRAPSRPSIAPGPSKVPLPPSQALTSVHPSASTRPRAPGQLRPVTSREGGGREPQDAAVSPSQVPIPVSIITVSQPLPSRRPPPPIPSLAPYAQTISRSSTEVSDQVNSMVSRAATAAAAAAAAPRATVAATSRASAVPGPTIILSRPSAIPEGAVVPSATTTITGGSHRSHPHRHPHTPASAATAPFPTTAATAAMTTTILDPSNPSLSLRSAYRDPEDLRRALLQTKYGTLAPAERAGQDAWATRKADQFAPCPFNFSWERDGDYPGYRCAGGAHYMSDMILAEGVPGLYARQGCHRGLKNWNRKPTKLEQVPPGMYGPVRPLGVDKKGRYTYFESAVDGPLTLKRSRTEPVFRR
ncbi:hypothetical protein SLS62_008146 [Diatrype stigma]|uniref:Uncharacterized protein n=1 Tax=Diatrype stigma TaxID=117547 RepID=A0AAN9YNX9_9PEZI